MSHDFEVVGSELLLDAPIIAVRRDEVVMPGGTTAFREVVEHFGAVAIVAIDDAERIAMVHQYRRSVDRRLWELPAGLLDIKGEDELTGARRELQEEVGLAAQDWSVLADIITSPGFCEEAVRVFLARDLSEVPRLAAEGDEEADMGFAWVALDDAVDQVISGEIANSIACTGILAAYAVLRSGRTPRSVDEPFELRPKSMAGRRLGPDLKKL
ncbi:NUDIX domain-containing protein [Corynebacterium striatum]|uniref:NUDIX domain-containing protein n=1 Tax=Corynebacterium striatum TaxID=43770 RepID=UPI001A23855A|nr:NUDIX hydrolase [Corynebacterium striatum]MDK8813700.1 NUDIX hydrolase [Corynebacterium striatum]HAT1153393.1 NUDIX hydrolase [Corynebacterium striatum]HAT1254466.1 NUDIX hydrolase [Corynebacterium striatum]HAT1266880.1 NUDIX hydrolase [Corynebacterium striatum]HAT1294344.1 NUDIX hydrolase [Corynebacterium striatum]